MPEITETLNNAVAQIREKADMYHEESKKFGTATAETREALDKINKGYDDLKARLDATEVKLGRQELVKPGESKEVKAETKAFLKWIRYGKADLLPEERKSLIEDTTGGYLIPEDIMAEVIRAKPQVNAFRQLATVVNTSRDKLRKRSITECAMTWGKVEGSASFSETTPTPATGYIYVEDLNGLIKLGKDELMDTDFNLVGYLADSFARAKADTEEAGFAVGRGHTTYEEPEGLGVDTTLQTSIGSGASAGTKGTYGMNWTTDDTVKMEDILYSEYLLPTQYLPNASYMVNRKTEYAMRVLRPETASGYYGDFFWKPGLAGQPNSFDGFPLYNNNSLKYAADTTAGINVIFGDFRVGYRIVDRMGMSIQRLDELYAEAGMVGFIAHFRVGGALVLPAAFTVVCNDT